MKPLQSIALGMVFLLLTVHLGGEYDVIPDPVGWLLILQGLGQLPAALPHRPALGTLGFVALLMSIVLWFPSLADGLATRDVSLLWAASVPQFAFVALVCRALADLADGTARSWLRTAAALSVIAALAPLPVLAAGGEIEQVLVLGLGAVVLTTVLLFRYSGRPWALADAARVGDRGPAATP